MTLDTRLTEEQASLRKTVEALAAGGGRLPPTG